MWSHCQQLEMGLPVHVVIGVRVSGSGLLPKYKVNVVQCLYQPAVPVLRKYNRGRARISFMMYLLCKYIRDILSTSSVEDPCKSCGQWRLRVLGTEFVSHIVYRLCLLCHALCPATSSHRNLLTLVRTFVSLMG